MTVISTSPVFSFRYFQWMSVEELSARVSGEYSDSLFRWLTARRDWPADQSPEPEPPRGISWETVRKSVFQEFKRSNPA